MLPRARSQTSSAASVTASPAATAPASLHEGRSPLVAVTVAVRRSPVEAADQAQVEAADQAQVDAAGRSSEAPRLAGQGNPAPGASVVFARANDHEAPEAGPPSAAPEVGGGGALGEDEPGPAAESGADGGAGGGGARGEGASSIVGPPREESAAPEAAPQAGGAPAEAAAPPAAAVVGAIQAAAPEARQDTDAEGPEAGPPRDCPTAPVDAEAGGVAAHGVSD
jgi:hypothetical protein